MAPALAKVTAMAEPPVMVMVMPEARRTGAASGSWLIAPGLVA
jgi:hypothetical protein